MQTHKIKDLLDRQVLLHGALDYDARPGGLSPRRLPGWTRVQLHEPMDVVSRMPSGTRLIFETDATLIAIRALTTCMVMSGQARLAVKFDLELKDTLRSQTSDKGNAIHLDAEDSSKFKLEKGQVDIWKFDKLPVGRKHCELWLPQGAFVELHDLIVNDGASISISKFQDSPLWVHYGSSISHCLEADQPSLIWPAVAARASGLKLHNLGLAGQCHLDQYIARTIRDLNPDLISIKAGINTVNGDQMRERMFKPVLHGFLDTIREKHATTPITLISPIYCPAAENIPGPTVPGPHGRYITLPGHDEIRKGCLTLSKIRVLIAELVIERADPQLCYVNGLSLFSEIDAADLPDALHPNAAGYIRMGQRFANQHLKNWSKTLTGSL